MPKPFSPPPETKDKLQLLAEMLLAWSPRINLIGESTRSQLATRHFAESIAINDAAPRLVRRWADLGSGGGFPGLVIAILRPESEVHLIESNQRKAVFLREAARALELKVAVHAARIESIPPLSANVVSARALAPLPQLLTMAFRHLDIAGIGIFPKGRTWAREVLAAQQAWAFDVQPQPMPGSDGKILCISELAPATPQDVAPRNADP